MSDWSSNSPGMDRSPQHPRVREIYANPNVPRGSYVVQAGQVGSGDFDGRSLGNLSDPRSPPNKTAAGKENLHRFAGLGVGLASVAAEHILSHPCIVLRRQCQVHHDSAWFHLTPFTLFQTIFNIQRHQSVTTLWKGIGSTLMVKGIGIATETALTEVTPLPKEVSRHAPIKKLLQHIILKGLGFIVITPFYAASLVETVQSEIASERPGVLDCLREGGYRLLSLSTPQLTRLLPVWKLFLPVVTYGVLHYVVASLAQYTVLISVKSDILEKKNQGQGDSSERSLYETYYPELIATFTGNLLADTLLFPLETILHRLCLQGTRTIIDNTDNGLGVIPIITRYEGFTDCLHNVITEEGVGGLYKGFGALVLQYGLHMAILKLTRLLFRFMSSDDFLSPEASPSRRLLPLDELKFSSPKQRVDGLPR